MSSIVNQAGTQLVSRAFMYAALLLVLPSYAGLSTPTQYANIVLLTTLASVANQFDGCYGTVLVSHAVQREEADSFAVLIKEALLCTIPWALLLGFPLVFFWGFSGGSSVFGGLTIGEIFALLLLCIMCALANVVNRVLFVRDFNKRSSLYLIGGPAVGLLFLVIFRVLRFDSLVLISLALCFGYLFTLWAPVAKNWIGLQCILPASMGSVLREDDARKWIFFSQLISIFLVAKNPYLIKALGGVDDLRAFSIYNAINSMILAPVAAMQMPLMVRMKVEVVNKVTRVARYFLVVGFGALLLATAVVIFLRIPFFERIFLKGIDFGYLHLIVVVISGVVASLCVVYALFLIVRQRGRLLVVSGLVVVISDSLFIFLLHSRFGSITPLVSIALANFLSVVVVEFILRFHGARSATS